ncbi:cache domain-containing sensor histidine kinase [Vallitalea okinawensis]|uniref:cache domain-containing sensor histidine kinase n=1 Tax=Vallitalea okinawensis TaxID=2078660 RepID=UPI000CFD7085|nr:histidine kinase [Vallitalea okinawensis]
MVKNRINIAGKLQAMKLKYKFTLVFLVSIIFLLMLSLISLQHTVHVYNNQLYETLMVSTNISSNTGDQRLKDLVDSSYDVITNNEFQDQLVMINESENYARYEITNEITDKLYAYLFNPDIASIQVICNNGDNIHATKVVSKLNQELLDTIYHGTQQLEGEIYWVPPSESTGNTIILARQIRQIKNLSLEPLGVLIFRIKPEGIVQGAVHNELNNNVFLISEDSYIYRTDSELPFEDVKPSKEDFNGYSIKSIKGHKYFFTYKQSNYNNWIYVNYIPYDELIKSALATTRLYIFIYLGSAIVFIYLINRIVNRLLKPVESLTRRMRKVENGDFHQEIENDILVNLKHGNEIDHLEYDFYLMLDKINHLIDENYIKQLQVKKFQIKALQAQINPHFLYNTLDSIFWLAKINQQKDISVMIKSLANLMRKSIDESTQIISIGEELSLLQDYINIQKIRHKDRLKIEMNVEEEVLHDEIPKLTLQPLVENSINYGLEKNTGECFINIQVFEDKDYVCLSVEDNGIGMSPELLEQLNKGLIKPTGTGIGVKNIRERLDNIYNNDFGLNYQSNEKQGTIVVVRVPRRRDRS